jgi:hypothetical protein
MRHKNLSYLGVQLGKLQPYAGTNHSDHLEDRQEWLRERFEQLPGNAEVVRQELV